MISVAKAGPDRLSLYLSPDEPRETKDILESLLGVRFNPKTGTYFVPVWDFPILAEKLARLQPDGKRDMDAAAWEVLRDYQYRLELNEQIKAGNLNADIEGLLAQVGKSVLWTDQVADVRFCLRNPVCGIFSEMGTGKTLIILSTFAMLRMAGLAKYALVVAPNSVKKTWARQIPQHSRLTVTDLGNGAQQTQSRLRAYERARTDVCITHYEALRNKDFQEALVQLPFDVICLDEAHAIKNMSQRTQATLETLSQIRAAVDAVEAEVELEDGRVVTAVLPVGVVPGAVVNCW